MKYRVQVSKYGNYIQTYATVLENAIKNFKVGEPTLLLVRLTTPDTREYTYYTYYGGGSGKLNIAVPEWLVKPGRTIEMYFERIDSVQFVSSIPAVVLDRPNDTRVTARKFVIEKVLLEKNKVKLCMREYFDRNEKTNKINCQDPDVGFDPRGVEIKEGTYAGAPYFQFNLRGEESYKTLRVYHNHETVRLAVASGRNFYTVRFLETENSELKILYEKKEEKPRLILAKTRLYV